MNAATPPTIALLGATGDLGARMVPPLVRRGAKVLALLRLNTGQDKLDAVRAKGAVAVRVDFDEVGALTEALRGVDCVVSALNGLAPVILDLQGRVLDAAPIRATSVLNGPFADMLTGEAPIVQHKLHRVLYWGDADQVYDFTTKDDIADYTADVALDPDAPRILRIAGDEVSPRDLAAVMSRLDRRPWKLLRAGGIGRLGLLIRIVRTLSPKSDAPFPAWQGMQYLRDMTSGRGKLSPLDNGRYGKSDWTRVDAVLSPTV